LNAKKSLAKNEPKLFIDKNKTNEIINNIYEFLNEYNYEKMISKKNLLTGSKHSFISMFSFLMKMVDPTLVCDFSSASEDYIIALLKMIGYPYSFGKNFFAHIGMPGSWSHGLFIINWLIELIKYNQYIKPSSKKKDVQSKSDQDIINDHIQKAFANNNQECLSCLKEEYYYFLFN